MTYLDISDRFLRDGAIDPAMFADPNLTPPTPALHPSPAGQARMAAAIEPVLSRLLGDRPH